MINYDAIFEKIEESHVQEKLKNVHDEKTCTKKAKLKALEELKSLPMPEVPDELLEQAGCDQHIIDSFRYSRSGPGPDPVGASFHKVSLDVFNVEIAKSKMESDNIQEIVERSKNLEVSSDHEAKEGVSIAMQARKMYNAVEMTRKKIARPHLDFQKAVKKYADGFSKCLKDIETGMLKKVDKFQAEKERVMKEAHEKEMARDAEVLKNFAEAAKEQGGTAKEINIKHEKQIFIPPTRKIAVEDGTSTTITEWVFDIEDKTKIPIEFLVVDEAKIKRSVKAGVRNIPGTKIYEKSRTQYRVK